VYILFALESRDLETKVIFAHAAHHPPFGVRLSVDE
jgi:hypothetical protein